MSFISETSSKGYSHKHKLIARDLDNQSGEKHFSCEVCNEQFTQKSDLNIHSLTHAEAKPFMCAICNKKFSEKRYLSVHLRIHS